MSDLAVTVLGYLLIFCRVAACLMVLPGFSTSQLPAQIRIYIAIGVSFSIYIYVRSQLPTISPNDIEALAKMILLEVMIGLVFALPVRFLFLALSFMGDTITNYIGLNPIPGTPIGDDQSVTTMSALFNITAVSIFFSLGMHLTFFLGLAGSFESFPVGAGFPHDEFLEDIVGKLQFYFETVVQLSAPILVYSVSVNLIAGLVNKLTPSVPVYFVSTPFLVCGGLALLASIGDDILAYFMVRVVNLINSLL